MTREEAEYCCKIAAKLKETATVNVSPDGSYCYIIVYLFSNNPIKSDFSGVYNFFEVTPFLNYLVALNKITEEDAILYRLSI